MSIVPSRRNKKHQFFYKLERHGEQYRQYPNLTRNMLAKFLGIEREDLDRLRPRGFILYPTGKYGRAPKWKRLEVIEWLKAGAPSSEDWEEIKRQWRNGGPS